jgi:hypothetical protein
LGQSKNNRKSQKADEIGSFIPTKSGPSGMSSQMELGKRVAILEQATNEPVVQLENLS